MLGQASARTPGEGGIRADRLMGFRDYGAYGMKGLWGLGLMGLRGLLWSKGLWGFRVYGPGLGVSGA